MNDPVLQFQHVSKCYYLGRRKAFIREMLPGFLNRHIHRANELWGLKDVSFEVRPGEALGIIGANGSGKTTTLSLLAGITAPTSGTIATRGKLGALIQLGAGFHPELTGRENVYLNAAILGLKRKEVNQIYDQIVEFAELEAFMDTPVKRYSSGMYARLGFSVAAHIHPDVLLVDEVLAVGDLPFQSKCMRRMHDFVEQGGAVVFVSHNLNMVQSLCSRAMWLDSGRCMSSGNSSDVISDYLNDVDRKCMKQAQDEASDVVDTGDIKVKKVVLKSARGEVKDELRSEDGLTIELHFHAAKRVFAPYFWLGITCKYGALFGANMLLDGVRPDFVEGDGVVSCTFQSLPLLPQVYTVNAGIRANDGATMLIRSRPFTTFRVIGTSPELGLNSTVAESLIKDSAPVLVPYEWTLPNGETHLVTSKGRLTLKQ